MVKNAPAMRETWVPSLGQEDPLEKGTATHSSTPAWRTPWTDPKKKKKKKLLARRTASIFQFRQQMAAAPSLRPDNNKVRAQRNTFNPG